MKKIKLKLKELNGPKLLSVSEMKSLGGGQNADFCYTGMSCGLGGTCVGNFSSCTCSDPFGYSSSPWCG